MEFLRRRIGLIIRCTVSLLAVAYVIHNYDWAKVWTNIQTMDYRWLLAGLFCFIPTLLIVSWRWRLLLGVHGVKLRFWRVFELTMIGQFFSTVGVGSTGGDVFKIFYVARAVPDRRTAVAFTVIVDRVIGMLALLLFGTTLASTRLPLLFFGAPGDVRVATGAFFAIALVGAVGGLLATLGPYFLTHPTIVALGRKLPGAERGKKIFVAYERSARAVGVNIFALFASIPSHMGITTLAYCVLRAMNLPNAPDLLSFCAIVAMVNLLIAMPVSISGIGFREFLFPKFLALLAIPGEKAITFSIIYFALNTVWNLAGGPFYFLYRHETHTPPPAVEEVQPIFEQ
jgi:uncharacterized membrane protein YbhN (UPF0104 family)